MTYAEAVEIATAKRLEEWDRVAFISAHAINANPYLERFRQVNNPFREPPRPAKMTEREVAELFRKLSEDR